VPLVVGAGDEARIAVLDLGADLGIRNAAATVEILGEAEEGHPGLGIVFLVLVERSAARPCQARHAQREDQCQSDDERCTCCFFHVRRPLVGHSWNARMTTGETVYPIR
jgi:hypothetical protein